MNATLTPKQQLASWIDSHRTPGKAFSVRFRTTAGRTEAPAGIVETFPWEEDDEQILVFEDGKGMCAFSTPRGTYSLMVVKGLVDRWGSRVSLDNTIDLADGIELIGYNGTEFTDYERWFVKLLRGSERGATEFIEWLFDRHPDLVDSIGENLVVEADDHSWHYYTTNLPYDHADWIEIVKEFDSEASVPSSNVGRFTN